MARPTVGVLVAVGLAAAVAPSTATATTGGSKSAAAELERRLEAGRDVDEATARCRQHGGRIACRWRGVLLSGGWTFACRGRASYWPAAAQPWRQDPCRLRAPNLAPLGGDPAIDAFGFNDEWEDRGPLKFAYAAAAGGDLLRFPIAWSGVEREPGKFDWSTYDRLHDAARLQGLGLMLSVQDSPCWARPSLPCGPNGGRRPDRAFNDEYARFVAAALARYPGVVAVEPWNEPNMAPYWLPHPDPDHYADLLCSTYRATKATHPDVPVIFAGLAPNTATKPPRKMGYVTFLEQAYESGAGACSDAIAFHAYTNDDRNGFLREVREKVADLKQVMARNGDAGAPVWITETGIADGVGAQEQASRIVQLYGLLARVPGVPTVIVHRMFDSGDDSHGLVEENGRDRKPAFCAVAKLRGESCGAWPLL